MAAMGLADLADRPRPLAVDRPGAAGPPGAGVASGAPLWLLDEPLNGLDSDGAERLDQAVGAHRANGGAVLAASHQPLGGDWRVLELAR